MATRWGRLSLEAAFVILMLLILKEWVFPFLISIWFPTDELFTQMSHWTIVMVGMITCFIYVGLGSSAVYHHRFSLLEGVFFFLCFHLVVLWGVPDWCDLLGDMIALFAPTEQIQSFPLFCLYFSLFLLGRGLRIHEKETEKKSQTVSMKTK